MQVNSPYLGIHIPKDDTQLHPGHDIFRKVPEWRDLCQVNECIGDFIPDLKTTLRCANQYDHLYQLGALYCHECNPNSTDY